MKLASTAGYTVFKVWEAAVGDWIRAHAQVGPAQLGPTALSFVGRLALTQELNDALARLGAFGGLSMLSDDEGQEVTWAHLLEAIRDRLQCSALHLRVSLAQYRQNNLAA